MQKIFLKIDKVWADLEDIDYGQRFPIEQFTVEIVSCGNTNPIEVINYGDKINEETRRLFTTLKHGDMVYFKDIFITLLGEKNVEIGGRRILVKQPG